MNCDECAIMLGSAACRVWVEKGARAIAIEKDKQNKRYTLLLGVTCTGVFVGRLIEGSCTSLIYSDFIKYIANRMGTVKYVLSADNCSIHRTHFARYVANQTDTTTLYTLAYYPEGCAIELVFSILKCRCDEYVIEDKSDLLYSIETILKDLPKTYFGSIFDHARKIAVKDALSY